MAFNFRTKHEFAIDGVGAFEFDIGNADMIAAIQREYPAILQKIAEGQVAISEYKEFCASLGIDNPDAKTVGELAKAVYAEISEHPAMQETVLKMTQDINDCQENTLAACVGFIEGCLGTAEYEQIFKNQKGRDMQDHIALCNALYADAMGQRDKSVQEEIKKNRALRRAEDRAAKKTPK